MKTEKEIKQEIKELKKEVKDYAKSGYYAQAIDYEGQITALEWVIQKS